MENESQSGIINPAELYTLKAFKRRLGIQDATLRTARRAGLRVTYIHKRGYVLGRDWIEYVLSTNPAEANAKKPRVNTRGAASDAIG